MSFKVSDYEQSTGVYLKEIGNFKPLTKIEEMDLWKKLRKNPQDKSAKNKLINSNLKFVVNVANHYKGRGLSLSDLVAEGNMGLLKAYERFDPSRDVKFISYSVHWIRQSIQEALEKRNSIDSEELPKDYEKQDNGVDEDFIEAENTPDLITKFIDFTGDSESERAANQNEAIQILFRDLNERELFIIKSYYGVGVDKPHTLEEIGKEMKLTKERVRQIKETGMKKLRSAAVSNTRVIDIYNEYVRISE